MPSLEVSMCTRPQGRKRNDVAVVLTAVKVCVHGAFHAAAFVHAQLEPHVFAAKLLRRAAQLNARPSQGQLLKQR